MQIGWISRKGTARLRNSDAASYGRNNQFVLAMLVDAAEKGNGQDLARHWCRVVIDAALGASQHLSLEGLVGILRAEQQHLRQQHLHAIASYCCVLVDLQQELLHVAHVGDCIVGIQPLGAPITWLNRPHNLQDQPILSKSPGIAESRHLLTRSLNAKRFCAPDCLTTKLLPDARLLICSDGYWHEHLHTGVDLHCVNDDASMLRIAPGESAIELQSDCDNFREWNQAIPA